MKQEDENHDFKLNYWKGNYEGVLDGLRECDWVMEFKDGTLEHNWTFFKIKSRNWLRSMYH